jgi:hypothetical protein
MKFILRLILIAIFTFIFATFMPWWTGIICASLVAFFIPGNNFNAFLSGLLGVGLVWLIMAWKVDIETGSIISSKMLDMFPVDDTKMLIIVSALLGGLSGALGAFTGNSFRQIFIKKKEKSFYS